MRPDLFVVLALIASPLAAQHDDHDHLAEGDGIRVLHAWTNAGESDEMRVYLEIENDRDAPVFLTGAETEIGGTGQVVGAAMKADGDPTPLPGIEIAAGRDMTLSPETVYVQIDGVEPRNEGDEVALHLLFRDSPEVEIHVETLSPDARTHPHAGHAH
ncbi:Copper(I)-binding protein [Palleronia marisminoris]|uniref:Copper chaperone PCu(A)C n=1 Tax=Palleronia marisminoris TaxID=315423 RepID=A0A1Y5TB84_9RHOB|nr:copper chaperone PCu(A)C [Palleronia marisminoris]SFH34669.1 Copper(I)-binding protein [Palleronia marisminoris]SLN59823.1 hypothetical protein PAM7066_02943 [Palleronia marisminoris]